MTESGKTLRVAVLISGGGTNLRALLDRAADGTLAAEIVTVVSDRPEAYGLIRARDAGVPAHVVDYQAHMRHGDREISAKGLPVDLLELDHTQKILKTPDAARRLRHLARLVLAEQELIGILDGYQPDIICLAGFMRLVTPFFLSHYNGSSQWRVLNIHPALLPAFPGQHGYEDTVAYGCKWGGITVHFVDEGEDSGPILAQAVYPIWPEDDVETVRRKGLQLEYTIYAQCINWLAAGQVEVHRASGGRAKTVVTDPSYREILKSWLKQM